MSDPPRSRRGAIAAWFEVHHRDCARRQGAMTTSFEIPHHRHRSPLGDLLATGGGPGPPGTKGIASSSLFRTAIHSYKIPSLAKSSSTRAAFRRRAAAMFATPIVLIRPTARFRNAAMTSGPEPLRIRLASSPRLTSRT